MICMNGIEILTFFCSQPVHRMAKHSPRNGKWNTSTVKIQKTRYILSTWDLANLGSVRQNMKSATNLASVQIDQFAGPTLGLGWNLLLSFRFHFRLRISGEYWHICREQRYHNRVKVTWGHFRWIIGIKVMTTTLIMTTTKSNPLKYFILNILTSSRVWRHNNIIMYTVRLCQSHRITS